MAFNAKADLYIRTDDAHIRMEYCRREWRQAEMGKTVFRQLVVSCLMLKL